MPMVGIAGYMLFVTDIRIDSNKKRSYGAAHAIAEEVFTAIRTVTAFGKQEDLCKKYKEKLTIAKNIGIRNILQKKIKKNL